jgi:hypothetical protein
MLKTHSLIMLSKAILVAIVPLAMLIGCLKRTEFFGIRNYVTFKKLTANSTKEWSIQRVTSEGAYFNVDSGRYYYTNYQVKDYSSQFISFSADRNYEVSDSISNLLGVPKTGYFSSDDVHVREIHLDTVFPSRKLPYLEAAQYGRYDEGEVCWFRFEVSDRFGNPLRRYSLLLVASH